jgi:hypothetical protein
MNPTRSAAWRRLTASPSAVAGAFDPADVDGLPAPARRLLRHALRPGVPLASTVVLEMTGELRLRRWLPFRARQVLIAGRGFVWAPRVGRPPMVVTGADTHVDGRGSLTFRLWGLVPVARESGPDTDRSTAGRLAAETVVWLPHALTAAMGATWAAVDDAHATVSVPVGDRTIDVTVTVAPDGRLRAVQLQRWGTPDNAPLGAYPFGGDVDAETTFDGVTIPSAGRVGWWWGTDRQDDGVFFRYRITRADYRARESSQPPFPPEGGR